MDAQRRRAAWLRYLTEIPDPFAQGAAAAAWPDFFAIAAELTAPPRPLGAERSFLPKAPSAWGCYLPIESFRDQADLWFTSASAPARIFRSSGTTQASRARSFFSARGLGLYRQASVACFFRILEELFGAEPWRIQGISLVPDPVSGWPESSLATMLGWIGEVADVRFAEAGDLAGQVDAKGPPVWLFGTAFHFVHAIDQGEVAPLPAGSVVVETGGTKGRSRAVERDELYEMISVSFGVPKARIVSEYGMSELASQAYDWDRGDGRRAFRFPSWCRPFVVAGPGEALLAGEGLLAVDDPLRLDFPYAIRTEDVALVGEDGSFQLRGRAADAPLKGCSLGAEIIATPDAASGLAEGGPATGAPAGCHLRDGDTAASFGPERLRAAAGPLAACLRSFLQSKTALVALSRELGSTSAARAALSDTLAAMPREDEGWLSCVTAAISKADQKLPRRWLFVLPGNHGLVGIYPLAVALLLNREVTVRLPAQFESADSFLMQLIAMLRAHVGACLDVVDARFRIGSPEAAIFTAADGLLVYGEDATVHELTRRWLGPVVGFGDHLTVSVLDAPTTPDALAASCDAIAHDALVTAQRGCLSTRLVVVRAKADGDRPAFLDALEQATSRFWHEPLAFSARLSQERAVWAARSHGFQPHLSADRCASLLLAMEMTSDALAQASLTKLVARAAFSLPVVFVREANDEAFVKATVQMLNAYASDLTIATNSDKLCADLRMHSVKHRLGRVSFCALGSANAPRWDGTHQGRALLSSFA